MNTDVMFNHFANNDGGCSQIGGYITLMNGDCMERMKEIPNHCVDLVLCDLPYGVLDADWDKRIDGTKLFSEYKRICKQNANVLLFCQMSFAKYLLDSTFPYEFSHCLVWVKSNKTRFKSKAYLPKSQYELILVFRINKYSNKESHKELRDWFMQELEQSGMTVNELEDKIPNRSAHHWFRYSSDYRIPTEPNYKRLQEITGRFPKPYSEIKAQFLRQKNNICTFNDGVIESDVIYGDIAEKRVHPTQKPVKILEKLICAYSNPKEVVLDNCMGSGSTGVACVNTGRRFVGIERDDNYFEIAKKRIADSESGLMQISLFDLMDGTE